MDGAAICYSIEKGERVRGRGVSSGLDTWTLRYSEGYLAAWPEAQRIRQREVTRIDRGENKCLSKETRAWSPGTG